MVHLVPTSITRGKRKLHRGEGEKPVYLILQLKYVPSKTGLPDIQEQPAYHLQSSRGERNFTTSGILKKRRK